MQFARSLAQGHVVVSDLYSNTQVMTGDVLSGLGSSAAILYYNDTVTYRDGTQEPMDLHVLPMPKTAGAAVSASASAFLSAMPRAALPRPLMIIRPRKSPVIWCCTASGRRWTGRAC